MVACLYSLFWGETTVFGRRAEFQCFGRCAIRASGFERECVGLDERSRLLRQCKQGEKFGRVGAWMWVHRPGRTQYK